MAWHLASGVRRRIGSGSAIALASAALVQAACGGASSPCQEESAATPRVAAWGMAPTDVGRSFADQSLRMIVSPRFHGGKVRIGLSNRFGTKPVTFASAWIGLVAAQADLAPGSNRRLTFACAESVTLAPGEERTSDPVALAFEPFQDVAVSLHVAGDSGPATRHLAALQTSYIAGSPAGDAAGDESGRAFDTKTTVSFFVEAVDVTATAEARAIVAFGDSITDGFVSWAGLPLPDPAMADQNARYPDFLARRLADGGLANDLSVINAGISGNRLLEDGLLPPYGPSGLSRLDADVIERAGVSDVLVLLGTNDLGDAASATADAVITGLQEVVTRLHSAGLRVHLGTQTPSSDFRGGLHGTPRAIAARNDINEWIRTQTVADGFVDFHAAVRDPANPDALDPRYDSGDHLHPNPAGYEAMADAIDLASFAGNAGAAER